MRQNNISKSDKLNKYYAVKSSGIDLQVKDVDMSKRIVKFIANTYYYLDSDLDILVNGASKRSINDRGPLSNAAAKIKHLADHKLSTDKMIGKPEVIEEKVIDGNTVLYFESKIAQGVTGDDHLIKYQEGIYDNHSIGFRYKDLAIADKKSTNEDSRKRYDEYYPQIINKEVADEYGYFWVVKEIELFEASVVAFGANSQTSVLGFKTQNKESIIVDLCSRIELMKNHLKNGSSSDESMKNLELQTLQIKQIISDTLNSEPSLKDEILKRRSEGNDTSKTKGIDYDYLINNLKL